MNCLADRLTLIVSGGPARARACQAAIWRQASRSTQHADRHDQAGLLGDRDEVGRQDQPALGMLPAEQRLEAAMRPLASATIGW